MKDAGVWNGTSERSFRMMRYWTWLGLALVCASLAMAGFAAPNGKKEAAKPKWTGTLRVQGKHTRAELKKMAKITPEVATRNALAAVPGSAGDKKVEETELEVENGFLVYSVEIRVNGHKGEYEVIVDASSGKVLAHEIEEDDDDEDDDEDDDD
jgi:hypothetical protein